MLDDTKHVFALLVSTADGAAQFLSHLGRPNKRLAFPGQHKDNPPLSGHFEQIGLIARLLQYQMASANQIELVGRLDSAIFKKPFCPRAANIKHPFVLANASILKRNASVCGYSTNAALLMDYSAFSPCLLGHPQTKGMVIHLPIGELVAAL
nr:hypothetical protein [Zoogloea sp.]